MAKKTKIDEIAKPDFVTEAIDKAYYYVLDHLKASIGVAAAVVVVVALVWGYMIYQDRKNERVQYTLSQGIAAFEAYSVTANDQALTAAEASFQEVKRDGRRGPRNIAVLYLGKISLLKGQKEEAAKFLTEVVNDSPDSLLKAMAEKSLQAAKTN